MFSYIEYILEALEEGEGIRKREKKKRRKNEEMKHG